MTGRKKRWIWVGVILTLLFAGACILDRYVISGRQVGEDNLSGLTAQQVRDRYGAPNDISPAGVDPHGKREELWIYYRGMFGGGTGIVFVDGVVTHWEMRGAR